MEAAWQSYPAFCLDDEVSNLTDFLLYTFVSLYLGVTSLLDEAKVLLICACLFQ